MQACDTVVVVNDYAIINGGATRVAVTTAIALAQAGLTVHFFASVGPADPSLEAAGVRVTLLNGEPYNRGSRLKSSISGIWDKRAASSFRNLLLQLDRKRTVVHAHTFRDALSPSVISAAIDLGFPTIYTAHEYSLGCPYGTFFDFRKNAICPLRGLSGDCLRTHCNTGSYVTKLWKYGAQYEFAKVAKIPHRLSHVVFVTACSQDILRPYVPEGVRTTVVANPLDFEISEGSQMGETSPFLFVGFLSAHKDPLTPARAALAMGAPMTFIGEGPLADEIKQINPGAKLTGWLSSNLVAQEMRNARALIFSSIWYETQGLTIMEAAASGLPSIVSDKCIAGYQVDALGAGSHYVGGDAGDLRRAMSPYLDLSFAREQGERARQACSTLRRTAAAYAGELREIYDDELSQAS
jgi:glycosyltransferase involved in cell wall biosynthesis